MTARKKNVNIQVGKRLREARNNLNKDRTEFSEALGVTAEHYRKLEAGATGLSADKLWVLHEKYGIDPTYLITGRCSGYTDFDLGYFVANSTKEQRNALFERVLSYISDLLK